MSGGKFSYKEDIFKYEVIEPLESFIENNLDTLMYDDPNDLERNKKVYNEIKNGLYYMNRAYVYAKRIDYLLSCDDGDFCFLKRLKEDLKKVEESEEKLDIKLRD